MTDSHTIKLEDDKLTFGCSAQGLPEKSYTHHEFKLFLEHEVNFWVSISRDIKVTIERSVHHIDIKSIAKAYLNKWRGLGTIDTLNDCVESLSEILQLASEFNMIIVSGEMGSRLAKLFDKSVVGAGIAIVHYSSFAGVERKPAIEEEIYRTTAILRLQEFYNPKISMLEIKEIENRLEDHSKNINALDQEQLKRCHELNKFSEKKINQYNSFTEKKADEFNKYVTSHQEQLDQLISYYTEKLTLEEPSKHWETSAKKSASASYFWLFIFILFILLPLYLMLNNWTTISDEIKILTTTNSGFNFGSLFVFTIPALAYGWILKQFSRNYIKASDAAADARHRRTLAMTYLALNKHSNVDEKERAIILNALFRSHNTNSSLEDGPPLGLIELLKK